MSNHGMAEALIDQTPESRGYSPAFFFYPVSSFRELHRQGQKEQLNNR